MDAIEITGGKPLSGEVHVSGSKNATLPQIAAALLAPGESILRGVPNLADVPVQFLCPPGFPWRPRFVRPTDGRMTVRVVGPGTEVIAGENLIATAGNTPNSYLYSGEWSDSVGLYNLRARYYNQATGRFCARDPAKGDQLASKN